MVRVFGTLQPAQGGQTELLFSLGPYGNGTKLLRAMIESIRQFVEHNHDDPTIGWGRRFGAKQIRGSCYAKDSGPHGQLGFDLLDHRWPPRWRGLSDADFILAYRSDIGQYAMDFAERRSNLLVTLPETTAILVFEKKFLR